MAKIYSVILRFSVLNLFLYAGSQGLVAIFLLFIIFHIIYDYTIKGAINEKIKI